jgi:hypothetical protein
MVFKYPQISILNKAVLASLASDFSSHMMNILNCKLS